MRINLNLLTHRRDGSLALEGIMVIPVVMVFILIAQFILEAMLLRHETAVYLRGSTVRSAMIVEKMPNSYAASVASCQHDNSDANARTAVERTIIAACNWRPSEDGMKKDQWFNSRMKAVAGRGEFMLKHLQLDRHVQDVESWGNGWLTFKQPPFLTKSGGDHAAAYQVRTTNDYWGYGSDKRWANGHDRAIWEELKNAPLVSLGDNAIADAFNNVLGNKWLKRVAALVVPGVLLLPNGFTGSSGTDKLFPNVFPARNL